MKGTAWELLFLVKDIWSKQGCILWLLINADLSWCAWKQSYEKWSKRTRRNQRKWQLPGIPLNPTRAGTMTTAATRIASFCFSPPTPQWMSEGRSPCDHQCYRHGAWRGCRSRHLCLNSLGSEGLGFHFSPTLLPLSGYKPVLSDETIRNSHYKTIFAMLVLGPHFHSSDFYWVPCLWWAGWYILQKLVLFILKFCMFLHRKTHDLQTAGPQWNNVVDTLIC